MTSQYDFWLGLRESYKTAHKRKTYLPRHVVAWAYTEDLWKPDNDTVIRAGVSQFKNAVSHETDPETGLRRDITFDDPQGTLWINWRDADWVQQQLFLNALDTNVQRAKTQQKKYLALFNANLKDGEPKHQLRLDVGNKV
ncbi:MAG TPA: hypothetical protein VJL59_12210 [Anaerolineales bacterium]|nr:hypothetical protein [Anaerolineales bacterium]